MQLKQSTARNRMVFMVDGTDGKTGLPGLTLTITASKNGGAFASITPTVTDRGSGWYNLALTTAHTDTLGDLALHITSTGADATDALDEVLVELPGAEFSTQLPESLPVVGDPPTMADAARAFWYLYMTKKTVVGTTVNFLDDARTAPAITFTVDAVPTTVMTRDDI